MGRFVKNLEFESGSYAIRLPNGSTTFGPQKPVTGQIKFNTDIDKLEVYYSNQWNEITSSHLGRVPIVKNTFVGDGVTTTFTMAIDEPYSIGDDAMIFVFVGNVFQSPGDAFTVNGYNITFSSPPPANIKIVILHNFNNTHAA